MGVRFAHPSERQFAELLDFYGVAWEYEPTTFVLDRDAQGRPTRAFSPDFFLPEHGCYIELTTLSQKLVTKKNAKVRRLRQLYPDVSVRVVYRRDFHSLLAKYGLEHSETPVTPGSSPEATAAGSR
ncbi:MAG TPA: hypothetical protein VK975_05605 [Acidimicrobiales bacterium]|nr:hypothetical protein [Acidimicrobiales bacterium]